MPNEPTVFYLDLPGAWGQFGLGVLLVSLFLVPAVAFSIPGVFSDFFPNVPKQRDPFTTVIISAVALALLGFGGHSLYTSVRTLRDRAPKLEFTPTGIIDCRGGNTVEWNRVVGASFSMEKTGDRVNSAVLTLTVLGNFGVHQIHIDPRGLSKSPTAIYNRMIQIRGLS